MFLSFVSRVDRKTWGENGEISFILSSIDLIVACDDDEVEFSDQLKSVTANISVIDSPSAAKILRLHDIDIDELVRDEAFHQQKGGAWLYLPHGALGRLQVLLMEGSENNAPWRNCLDEALKHEHLYIQFSAPLYFSRFAENHHVKRPVTQEQFLAGTPKFETGLPSPCLVRRHESSSLPACDPC